MAMLDWPLYRTPPERDSSARIPSTQSDSLQKLQSLTSGISIDWIAKAEC
jgi:hypothetical protein